MLIKYFIKEFEEFKKTLNKLQNDNTKIILFFYGTKQPDGLSWCSDCRKGELNISKSKMSFLSRVFGGKTEDKGVTPAEAIQRLRETEEMLIKKQEFLEKKVDSELTVAKKCGTKNKRAALQALKRKNRYLKQLQQIDGTLATIEMQREALEGANTNTTVLQTMKGAADALKKAHQHMDIEQVHDMMDDIAEQQDIAKEISEAISNPVAFGNDVDEDELEKELEELEQEQLDKELLDLGPSARELPSVPSSAVEEPSRIAKPSSARAAVKEDDDDMKELQKWAS